MSQFGSVGLNSRVASRGGDDRGGLPAITPVSPEFRVLLRLISSLSFFFFLVSYSQGEVLRPFPVSVPSRDSLSLVKPYYEIT